MIASQFAFAGRAFLDTDARRLRAALEGDPHPTGGQIALLEALEAEGQDLEVEYVRLFLSPAGAPCPPWQSAQEEEGRLMGPAHQSARQWYARYGAAPKAESEPADHIGLLLTFYAQMVAVDAEEEDRRRFARQHLVWIPEFAGKVSRETRLEFYRLLGQFTGDLVRSELK